MCSLSVAAAKQIDWAATTSPQQLYLIMADDQCSLVDRQLAHEKLFALTKQSDSWTEACLLLGKAYAERKINYQGRPVPPNDDQFPDNQEFSSALELWERVAKAGNAEANLLLGNLYQRGVAHHMYSYMDTSLKYWIVAAKKGNTEALAKLKGMVPLILEGKEPVNDSKAVIRAQTTLAAKGDVNSSLWLGKRYFQAGEYVKAHEFLTMAAKGNNEEAQGLLAKIGDISAIRNSPQGMSKIVDELYRIVSDDELPPDEQKEAYDKLHNMSESGNAEASYSLGEIHLRCYVNAAGEPLSPEERRRKDRDNEAAIPFWERAAKAGHALANYNLGLLYSHKNIVKAAEHWIVVMEKGGDWKSNAEKELRSHRSEIEQCDGENGPIATKMMIQFAKAGDSSAAKTIARRLLLIGHYEKARQYVRMAQSEDNTEEAKELLAEIDRCEAEQKASGLTPIEKQQALQREEAARQSALSHERYEQSERETRHGRMVAGLVLVWSVISIIGFVAGLKGQIIVYRSWGEVILAAMCLSLIIYLICVGTDISGSPGVTPPWYTIVLCIGFLFSLGFLAYQANGDFLKAALALPTQLFVVGLLLALFFLSLSKIRDVGRSKTKAEKAKNMLGAAAAIAGTGVTAYLLNRLVRTGAQVQAMQKAQAEYAASVQPTPPSVYTGEIIDAEVQPQSLSMLATATVPTTSTRTSKAAVASLITGIIGLPFPYLFSIPALVLGIIGLRKTKDPHITGKGMAIAGITLGAVGIFITFFLVMAILTHR